MPKKIAFLADCLVTQKAGIHFYTHQFIKRAIEDYPQNQYFIILEKPYGQFEATEIIVPTNKSLPFHFRLRSFTSIPKAVNRLNPDVVIEMAHFGPFRLNPKIKRVTVIYDLTPILFPKWHNSMSYWIHKIFLPGIIKKSNKIICISKKTQTDLIELYPHAENKTLVSYPFVNPKVFIETKKTIHPHAFFLSVGTIEPRKNYLTLVKAFEIFAATNENFDLIIIGYNGWKSNTLLNYIKASPYCDRIILKGYVSKSDLRHYYRQCMTFIYPTHYEGFGLPLLEAFHFNKPILASDIDICREVCQDAAIYFSKDQHQDLANKMQNITHDKVTQNRLAKATKTRLAYFTNLKLGLQEIFE